MVELVVFLMWRYYSLQSKSVF